MCLYRHTLLSTLKKDEEAISPPSIYWNKGITPPLLALPFYLFTLFPFSSPNKAWCMSRDTSQYQHVETAFFWSVNKIRRQMFKHDIHSILQNNFPIVKHTVSPNGNYLAELEFFKVNWKQIIVCQHICHPSKQKLEHKKQ